MSRLLVYMVLWFGLFSGVRSWGQTIEGGGVYLETGARMINSLVTGNKAKEGYGIAGGDAVLLNCTVCRNFSVRELRSGVQPGDIFCANGEIVDLTAYESRTEKDAIGVVFWVNSDAFVLQGRFYVMALEEAFKAWGTKGVRLNGTYRDNPLQDTACYSVTAEILEKDPASEAAVYCSNYRAEGEPAGVRWCFPAGYQVMAMYVAWPAVDKTLRALKVLNPDRVIMPLEEDVYWCATTNQDVKNEDAWVINFGHPDRDSYGTAGAVQRRESTTRDKEFRVRPIFVY